MVHVLLINFAETKVTVMFLHCEVINNAQQCKTKMHTISNIRIVGERELMEYEEDNYVLYCIDGVVIAAQCTATFSRYIVLPEFR